MIFDKSLTQEERKRLEDGITALKELQNLIKKDESHSNWKEIWMKIYKNRDIVNLAFWKAYEIGLLTKEEDKQFQFPKKILKQAGEFNRLKFINKGLYFIILSTVSMVKRSVWVPCLENQVREILMTFFLEPAASTVVNPHTYGPTGKKPVWSIYDDITECLNRTNAKYWATFNIEVAIGSYYETAIADEVPVMRPVLKNYCSSSCFPQQTLYPKDQYSLRLGTAAAPYLADIVLAKLEEETRGIEGIFRYNESVLIFFSEGTGKEKTRETIDPFLRKKGLNVDQASLKEGAVEEGFNFLSTFYQKDKDKLITRPSPDALDGLCTNLHDQQYSLNLPYKDNVDYINSILKWWRAFHREENFHFIDLNWIVWSMIVINMFKMNPDVRIRELMRMFTAMDKCFASGKNVIPESKFNKDLIRLENPITLSPTESKPEDLHVCPLCGRLMLGLFDQTSLEQEETGETIWAHRNCYNNIYETIQREETFTPTHKYDFKAEMKYYREHAAILKKHPAVYDPESETYKLREYLQQQTKPFLTITFSKLEEITGKKLPPECRTVKSNWNMHTKAHNYLLGIYLGGYKFYDIDLLNQKLFLSHNKDLGLNKIDLIKYFQYEIPFQAKFVFDCELRRIYQKYGINDLDNYDMDALLKELKKQEKESFYLK